MVVRPRVRAHFCVNAHPVGCAENVRRQIDEVRRRGRIEGGPCRVLVVGASAGYGLASRIMATFGLGAQTLGVFFERPATGLGTATAGWYNAAALDEEARRVGLYARNINGDAFSDAVKQRVVQRIREDWGPESLEAVVYSLAAPQRTDPDRGEIYRAVLKPIGEAFSSRSLDTDRAEVIDVTLKPASEAEIRSTVQVMGGEDWQRWLDALEAGGVLAPSVRTWAYSYLGPELTWPIYRHGTIGRAKEDLDRTARRLDARLRERGGRAQVAVMKAIVTQSAAAVPVVPLYLSLLYRVMKDGGDHERAIEQVARLFHDHFFAEKSDVQLGELERPVTVRLDDLELKAETQAVIAERWSRLTTDNLQELADLDAYRRAFLQLFGFEVPGVDYDADVDLSVDLPLV